MEQPIYSVLGDRYTFLLTGEQTGGAYSVFEFLVPPGGGSPPHVHHREDELFMIVDGEFEFTIAGKPQRVGPGGYVNGVRDVPHNFKNVGSVPGHIICTAVPSGLEHFFAAIGTRLPNRETQALPPGEADIRRVFEAAPKFGIEILMQGSPHA